MSAKRELTFSAIVLGAVLLVSFLLYFVVSRNHYAAAAPASTAALTELDPRAQIGALVKQLPQTLVHPKPIVPAISKNSAENKVIPYVTTAYYLNVRDKPSPKSKILNVVKKGTILKVRQKTGNGWLQLEAGGYVHGRYAVPAKAGTQTAKADTQRVKPQPSAAALPSKPTSAVYSDSGLTLKHIEEILRGTALENQSLEAAILEIEEDYGINAYFTIAVMKLESGNGSSRLAKTKNNLFGLNATGKGNKLAFHFDTKADSVRKFGQLMSKNYVGKGYTTVEKVAIKYCPANSKWPKLVKNIMYSDHDKI